MKCFSVCSSHSDRLYLLQLEKLAGWLWRGFRGGELGVEAGPGSVPQAFINMPPSHT